MRINILGLLEVKLKKSTKFLWTWITPQMWTAKSGRVTHWVVGGISRKRLMVEMSFAPAW